MTTATDHDQLQKLLAEAPWLRRLAQRLGGHDAEDLMQQTWVAALQRPPDAMRPARPWLHRVLQNFAGMAGRRKRQREVFESLGTDAAQDLYAAQAVPQADADLEERQLHHLLGRLLTQLEEPYRSAVVARYIFEQQLEETAATMKIPAGTLRWRVNEGLRRLRERMQREQKGQLSAKAWAPGLIVSERGRAFTWWKAMFLTLKKAQLMFAGIAAALAAVTFSFLLAGRSRDLQESTPQHVEGWPVAEVTKPQAPAPKAANAPVQMPGFAAPQAMKTFLHGNLPIFKAPIFADSTGVPLAKPAPPDPGVDAPQGELNREAIATGMSSIIPGVRDCYEKLLEERPDSSGRMVVTFTIGGKDGVGKISNATIVPPAEEDPRPEKSLPSQPLTELCILNAVQKASFPPPAGNGNVVVTYPFNFESDAPKQGKQNR